MKFSRAWLFLILFQAPLSFIYGQGSSLKHYTFNLKYHAGFVMNHSMDMAHLANQRPQGIEADIYKTTNGEKTWQQIHNYPLIGYSFQYFSMDKNKPLGDSYSLIKYYGKRILKTSRSSLSYRMGFGAAYIERRFDKNTNYKNNLISTRLSFTLNGRINYSYAITKQWNINAGIGLMHFSNGAIKVPNLGINIPSIHIGFGFCPEPLEKIRRDSLPVFKKETQVIVSLAGGFKQVYPVEGPSYFISTLSAYVNRKVNRKSALNIGMEAFYDASNKTVLDTLPSDKQGGGNYFKLGLAAGHELYIGKVSLLTQLGFYLYDPLRLARRTYQRIGLKYYVTDNLFGIIGLKLHLGQADLVEWGVGVKF